MRRHGFTIVELMIAVTVMGILIVLAVVNVSSSQMKARDDERKTDIQAIQLALETYYTVGNDTSQNSGSYPPTSLTSSESKVKEFLRDINTQSVISPNQSSVTASFKPATNAEQAVDSVTPQPTANTYVYQPLTTANSLCTSGECRRYNLFYKLESDNTVYRVTSKAQ